MAEPSFTERAGQRLQALQQWESDRRAGLAPRRTVGDTIIGVLSIGALILLVLAVAVVAVLLALAAAGPLLTFVGAAAIVVLASLVWQRLRGQ